MRRGGSGVAVCDLGRPRLHLPARLCRMHPKQEGKGPGAEVGAAPPTGVVRLLTPSGRWFWLGDVSLPAKTKVEGQEVVSVVPNPVPHPQRGLCDMGVVLRGADPLPHP